MKKLISIFLFLSLSCICVVAEEPTLTDPMQYEVRWDDVSGTTMYIGWATPGTATSVSEWRMARMTYTGDDWILEWADDDLLFDNEWDERAGTVTY